MTTHDRRGLRELLAAAVLALATLLGTPSLSAADETATIGRTPPRLSLIEGDASFWRPGAEDWVAARLNMPLEPGDALYTGDGARLELQIGARAFVRLASLSQVGLEAQEPDFVQLKVTAGRVTLDLRELQPGHGVELDTPNAAFTVNRTGYYRVDVDQNTTTFVTRRGGAATVTPAGGAVTEVGANDQVIVEGTESAQVATYNAPGLDDWDRWNYDRTDHLLAAARSATYLSPEVYGADTLDYYGDWRVDETYGPLWVPSNVSSTWAPYSTGQWVSDPTYGWTWIDDAPWGWAPYHYGRWVYASRCWAWAPGPIVAAPAYAPALVAFFGGHGFHIGIGVPFVSWVALGWGEPVVPWWGGVGFVGVPWWGGWGGPRIFDNVIVNRTTIIDRRIGVHDFRNTHVPHAVVTVRRDRFGHGDIRSARLAGVDVHHLQPVRGRLPFKPGRQSLVPTGGRSGNRVLRPPHDVVARRVVATRSTRDPAVRLAAPGRAPRPAHEVMRLRPHQFAATERPLPGSVGNARQPRRADATQSLRAAPRPPSRLAAPPPPPHSGIAGRSQSPRFEERQRSRPPLPSHLAPPAARHSSPSSPPRPPEPRGGRRYDVGRAQAPPRFDSPARLPPQPSRAVQARPAAPVAVSPPSPPRVPRVAVEQAPRVEQQYNRAPARMREPGRFAGSRPPAFRSSAGDAPAPARRSEGGGAAHAPSRGRAMHSGR